MTHSTAKAIAFASTKDWNIGGKFTAKATDSTTMEISGGYSSSSSETITRTDSFEDSVPAQLLQSAALKQDPSWLR
ncbi:hypothetical protein LOZ12_002050 [Ophidiomyces ophidiicola]|uniref:Uncharacterized protein n=1 Tax=Ophidiomyces ophidiicola TaxID=1387563 RepID=A0ACB8UZN1_9EURO|nr:hypothetical protein LOZ61_004507 [Ophidiomyces ophidiicola]KAI1919040.1 hypothetical protein LOZ64_002411 [Ophidiomyces ophidiicola]KAI1924953.1 hypothetical protein LOZ60_004396 [Ophidiomyces ophidiicola]KAI1952160.1 hypothetical protein LOZ62_001472 [Ophidiomyces ophidiicola]KAI1960539.1 hypothetical protein LOZ59_002612 [Ophidiomyces ophidiicola]